VERPPDRQAGEAAPRILPDDVHNRELIRNAHPEDWVNPTPPGRYHLVVIGAGTAGLTAAAGAATVGARVALIERHLTGGDCLVSGCVPSKGIISAARVAAQVRHAAGYGVRVPPGVSVDFPAVMERMRRLRARISPADSVRRLAGIGVDVFLGEGRFTGRDTVEVNPAPRDGANGTTLRFARAVIATGGRAELPPIPGLQEAGCLTNETIFQLTQRPARLVVIGGGPIGCEMAQTFQRLGSQVTLIHNAGHILNREDADAAQILQQRILREGIRCAFNAKTQRVTVRDGVTIVTVEQEGKVQDIACEAILVSAGRVPSVEGLGLEAASVAYDQHGVRVDDFLRTSNPRVFAAGDVASAFKFTHTANALGRMAMINALLWKSQRASRLIVPWCTYTDPEIAHVGLYERQANERGIGVTTLTARFADNDRAILDGEDEGFVRVHLKRGTDRILGATVVAAHAGDLLTYFTSAMVSGKGLSSLASPIYPYPTQSELLKKLAGLSLQARLTPTVKRLLRALMAWKR
jgi:pyruvate/2-oxoglutarate dehydrogenase complex dihydrolipoamide dehydrogenase (E3) component